MNHIKYAFLFTQGICFCYRKSRKQRGRQKLLITPSSREITSVNILVHNFPLPFEKKKKSRAGIIIYILFGGDLLLKECIMSICSWHYPFCPQYTLQGCEASDQYFTHCFCTHPSCFHLLVSEGMRQGCPLLVYLSLFMSPVNLG